MKGRKKKEIRGMKNKEIEITIERQEFLDIWKNHYTEKFEQHLNEGNGKNEETKSGERSQQIKEIKMGEIEEAIRKIKTGKAGEADNIERVIIKWLGEERKKWLALIFNEAWKIETIPKDCENNLILPIYKKGDHANCENYRAIYLSSVGFKVYTRIVEKRLRKQVEKKWKMNKQLLGE